MMARRRKLLVLATYPPSAAATRFRACAYFPILAERGIDAELHPFLSESVIANFYQPKMAVEKAVGVLKGLAARVALLARSRQYDAIFVQREAAIVGPALFEAALVELGLPMVFDLDDAIWVEALQYSKHPVLAGLLKSPAKTDSLLRRAHHVIAASRYVASYSSRFARDVTVLPTVVSRELWTPLPGRLDGDFCPGHDITTIGWVGSFSTGFHLDMVVPALRTLAREGHKFRVRLVGASRTLPLENVEVESVPWALEREIADFRNIDIGIAPVVDDDFTRGKCGFKQIQYLTVGVPMVSSVVGGGGELLTHGETALLVTNEDQWVSHLRDLLTKRELRAKLSRAGRALAESSLSMEAQQGPFADIIESALASRRR